MRTNSFHRSVPSRFYDLPTRNGIGGVATRLQSRTFGQWASARPLIGNRPHLIGALLSEPSRVSSAKPDAGLVRPIRAALWGLLEGILVIAVFAAIIAAVLAVKLAIWTPYFHR
jgi:hypothetical protein